MADVFDEISDDLRREKLNQFWKENGAWIIGGIIAAVFLTAFLSFWRQWEYRQAAAATTELVRLVTSADPARLENFAKASDKNHATAARFLAAGNYLEHGDKDHATALYNDIAATFGIDAAYRDLARLLSVVQRLDGGDPEKLKKELSGLSGDKNPWRYTARELEALLAARQGQAQEAVAALTKITADPLAPPEARTRAFTLRELYIAGSRDEK